MIQLNRIYLKDFMFIEELELSLDEKQVVMVAGENGSGKSSLMAAIALAFIEYKKGDAYRDFVRLGCPNAYIEIDALVKGEPIKFNITLTTERYGTPLTRTIEYKDHTYVNSDCKALLDSLDIDHLRHVMFLFQGDSSIVSMKPAERARLLRKLFHLEFESQVTNLKTQLENAKNSKIALEARLDQMSQRTFTKVDLLPEEPIEEIEAKISEVTKELQTIYIPDLSEEEVKREELCQHTLKKDRLTRSIKEQEEDIKESEALIKKASQASLDDIQEPTKDLDKLREQLEEATSKYITLNTKRTEAEKHIKTLKNQINIYKEGLCHFCGAKTDGSKLPTLTDALTKDTNKLKKLEKEIIEKADLIEEFRGEFRWASNEKEDYEKAINDYNQTQEKANEKKLQLDKVKETLEDYKGVLTGVKAQIKDLEQELVKFDELNDLRSLKKSKTVELERLQKVLENRKNAYILNNERRRQNEVLEREREQHAAELKELLRSITTNSNYVETLKEAVSIFETQFPNFIILQACSQIEDAVNTIVRKVFPTMSVKLSQNKGGVDFHYTPTGDDNGWLPVKMASGAQAAILSVAWQVAIAKLYAVELLLLDEIDASSTDENSRIIYEFISSLDTVNQLIVISHRKEAMRAVASIADNVLCYWVSNGHYSLVDDPENY